MQSLQAFMQDMVVRLCRDMHLAFFGLFARSLSALLFRHSSSFVLLSQWRIKRVPFPLRARFPRQFSPYFSSTVVDSITMAAEKARCASQILTLAGLVPYAGESSRVPSSARAPCSSTSATALWRSDSGAEPLFGQQLCQPAGTEAQTAPDEHTAACTGKFHRACLPRALRCVFLLSHLCPSHAQNDALAGSYDLILVLWAVSPTERPVIMTMLRCVSC